MPVPLCWLSEVDNWSEVRWLTHKWAALRSDQESGSQDVDGGTGGAASLLTSYVTHSVPGNINSVFLVSP